MTTEQTFGYNRPMLSALIRTQLETELTGRYTSPFCAPLGTEPETVPTGIREIDQLTGGLPRGRITEVFGPVSSGRTSLLLSTLSLITRKEEVCVLVDPAGTLDPISAAALGVDFNRLLWVRTGPNIDRTLKVTDLLLQGGGFGLIGVDFSELSSAEIRRVPPSSWFRLQRAAEKTPTILLFLGLESSLGTCASLALSLELDQVDWSPRVLRRVHPHAQIVRSRMYPTSRWNSCRFRLQSFDCQRAVGNNPVEGLNLQQEIDIQGVSCHEF